MKYILSVNIKTLLDNFKNQRMNKLFFLKGLTCKKDRLSVSCNQVLKSLAIPRNPVALSMYFFFFKSRPKKKKRKLSSYIVLQL